MFLRATTDLLRVVTSAAGDVECHVSAVEVDNAAPPVVQDIRRVNTASIVAAATTTILDCTTANRRCRVTYASILNNSGSVAQNLEVLHTDGTNIEVVARCNLLVGEKLEFDGGRWIHYDANGAEYAYSPPVVARLGQTGVVAESIPRELCAEVNTTVGATGVLFMQAIWLQAGTLVSNIILWSATTAAGTPTNYAAGLYDANRNLLANSANQTTSAWAANSQKTFPMTTAYRVPTSGVYYIGYYMTATTVATLKGGTAKTGGQLAAAAPILHGTSTGSLTTALPNPAAAITAGTANIYAAIS